MAPIRTLGPDQQYWFNFFKRLIRDWFEPVSLWPPMFKSGDWIIYKIRGYSLVIFITTHTMTSAQDIMDGIPFDTFDGESWPLQGYGLLFTVPNANYNLYERNHSRSSSNKSKHGPNGQLDDRTGALLGPDHGSWFTPRTRSDSNCWDHYPSLYQSYINYSSWWQLAKFYINSNLLSTKEWRTFTSVLQLIYKYHHTSSIRKGKCTKGHFSNLARHP